MHFTHRINNVSNEADPPSQNAETLLSESSVMVPVLLKVEVFFVESSSDGTIGSQLNHRERRW
jgi:hypothetical protein